MFQKKYPDIYLTLETGMSGEDTGLPVQMP